MPKTPKTKESFISFKQIQETPGSDIFWEIRAKQGDLALGRIKILDHQILFAAYQNTVFEKLCLRDIMQFMETLEEPGVAQPIQAGRFVFKFIEKKTKTSVWNVRSDKSHVSFGAVHWYSPWRCYGFYPHNGYHFSKAAVLQIAEFLEAEDTKQKEAASLARYQKKNAEEFLIDWLQKP